MSATAMATPPGTVQRIVAAARRLQAEGRDIVRLDMGEPDFPTPPHIVDAAARAMRDGATKYVAPAGLPALRDALAQSVGARGVRASAEQVVVTAGARPMLWYALLALVSPGDEVLVPDPGYPGYASAIALTGGTARPYPLAVPDGYALDVDALGAAITPATRVLVLNAPQNPTGCVLTDADRAAVAELALRHDLTVVTDEIYSSITFAGRTPPSIMAIPGMAERTVLVDGFSKTYAMTGWRLGYGVMPNALAERVASLVSECTTCTPPFVQHAGLAALHGPQDAVAEMRDAYHARHNALVDGLAAIPGVRPAPAGGAFYVFADLREALGGRTDAEFVEDLLHGHGVACIPGSAYGRRGEGCVRFALTQPTARLYEAIDRVKSAVQRF